MLLSITDIPFYFLDEGLHRKIFYRFTGKFFAFSTAFDIFSLHTGFNAAGNAKHKRSFGSASVAYNLFRFNTKICRKFFL